MCKENSSRASSFPISAGAVCPPRIRLTPVDMPLILTIANVERGIFHKGIHRVDLM